MIPLKLTRLCLVSALGHGLEATLAALFRGRSGLRPCDFETVDIPTHIGRVAGLDESIPAPLDTYDCRNNRLARLALEGDGFRASVARAVARYGAHRIGVFAGTSTAGMLETELAFRNRDVETGALPPGFRYRGAHNNFSIGDYVQRVLGLGGPALAVSAACASTAKAFGNAGRMIELGLIDAAVVGGADSLCLTTLYGFHSLQLASEAPCRPFDEARAGISIGEAAGFALVEPAEGPDDGIVLKGFGESSDAHHMSSPHPEGLGACQAMAEALAGAGLDPEQIGYINLHGTATRAGDASEDKAVTGLFGTATPCSSTKGLTGHTLGAAGITEAVIAALCLTRGLIPPSPTTRRLDPALRLNYLASGGERRLTHVMSNSFGFGGSNCSLILGWNR